MENNNKDLLLKSIETGTAPSPEEMCEYLSKAGSRREILLMGIAIGLNAKGDISRRGA